MITRLVTVRIRPVEERQFARTTFLVIALTLMSLYVSEETLCHAAAKQFVERDPECLQAIKTEDVLRTVVTLFEVIDDITVVGGAKSTQSTSIWHLTSAVKQIHVLMQRGYAAVNFLTNATNERLRVVLMNLFTMTLHFERSIKLSVAMFALCKVMEVKNLLFFVFNVRLHVLHQPEVIVEHLMTRPALESIFSFFFSVTMVAVLLAIIIFI